MPTPIEYADSPTQDWNVYLGLTPDPRVPRVPIPQVDPWGGLNVAGMELPLDEAMKVTHMAATLRAQQEEARAAAIRYQGTMEFQYLLGKGVDSGEAIRQTAGKMFYGHPAGLASAIRQTEKTLPLPSELTARPVKTEAGELLGHAWINPASGSPHFIPNQKEVSELGTTQEVFDPEGNERIGVVVKTGPNSATFKADKATTQPRFSGDIDVGNGAILKFYGTKEQWNQVMSEMADEQKKAAAGKAKEASAKPGLWDQVKGFFGGQPAQVTPAGLGASPQRTIVQPPIEAPSPPMEEPNPYPDTLPSFSVPAPAEPAPMGMGLNVRDGMSVPAPMTNAVPVPPLPAAVAPAPPTVAPTEGVRIDPVLGRMTPELDRFYAMTPAEQRMYALTNKSFGAPKPAVAPATTVVHTNMVPPDLTGKATVDVLPLPKEKAKLIKGRLYNTKHGPAMWDGEKFIQD